MKRIVGSFLVLVLSISLAACGKADMETNAEDIKSSPNTVEESQVESEEKAADDTVTDKEEKNKDSLRS